MGGGAVSIYVNAAFANDWQTSVTTPDTSWLAVYDNITITEASVVNDSIGISQETASSNLPVYRNHYEYSGISLFSGRFYANTGRWRGRRQWWLSIGGGSWARLTGTPTRAQTPSTAARLSRSPMSKAWAVPPATRISFRRNGALWLCRCVNRRRESVGR